MKFLFAVVSLSGRNVFYANVTVTPALFIYRTTRTTTTKTKNYFLCKVDEKVFSVFWSPGILITVR